MSTRRLKTRPHMAAIHNRRLVLSKPCEPPAHLRYRWSRPLTLLRQLTCRHEWEGHPFEFVSGGGAQHFLATCPRCHLNGHD